MDDGIVSIALKWDTRVVPLHPQIKRIMQEEIGEQRTHDSALWRAFRSLLQRSIWTLHGGTQPPRNVETDPRRFDLQLWECQARECLRWSSLSRRVTPAAGSTSLMTFDSRSYRDSPSDLSRMPPATHHRRRLRRDLLSPSGMPPRQGSSEYHKASLQARAPPIAGWPAPSARSSGPFAPPALSGFFTTTSLSAPPPRIGTLPLAGLPLGSLPSTSRLEVPTFRTRACAELTPPLCRPPLRQ